MSTSINLSLWNDDPRHVQQIMRDLGITYSDCECWSTLDLWKFKDCENIPTELPAFMRRYEVPDRPDTHEDQNS